MDKHIAAATEEQFSSSEVETLKTLVVEREQKAIKEHKEKQQQDEEQKKLCKKQDRYDLALYSVIANACYELQDRHKGYLINWSTLSIAGLLTVGLAKSSELSFNLYLWLISIAMFLLSCITAYYAQHKSIELHHVILKDYPKNISKEDELNKEISYFNKRSKILFFVGLLTAIIVVILIIL